MMADTNPLRQLYVQDLLELYPETVPVFMRHRMACVGCDITALETVAEAIDIYRLDGARFLDELMQVIQSKGRTPYED